MIDTSLHSPAETLHAVAAAVASRDFLLPAQTHPSHPREVVADWPRREADG